MDISTNNISFQAKLVTRMKGRHNILERVGKNFELKTNGREGSLYIYRNNNLYPGGVIFSIDKSNEYILHDAEELFGANIKDAAGVTEDVVNKITKTFVNIYKALKKDSRFEEIKKEYNNNFETVKNAYAKNMKALLKLKEKGDNKNAKIYEFLVEQNRKRFLSLEKDFNIIKSKYRNDLEKMAKNEPYLDVWRDVLAEDLV